jgi:hypothetical protein
MKEYKGYYPGWSDEGIPETMWEECDKVLERLEEIIPKSWDEKIIDAVCDELSFRRARLPRLTEKAQEEYFRNWGKGKKVDKNS